MTSAAAKRTRVDRYTHTGGFNRLAGRPSAPGSWRSGSMCRKWKILYTAVSLLFLAIGAKYLLF